MAGEVHELVLQTIREVLPGKVGEIQFVLDDDSDYIGKHSRSSQDSTNTLRSWDGVECHRVGWPSLGVVGPRYSTTLETLEGDNKCPFRSSDQYVHNRSVV